jgi:hypothetical protein
MDELADGCTMWRWGKKVPKRCQKRCGYDGVTGARNTAHHRAFPQPVSLISAVGWMASLGGMGSGTVTCGTREEGGDVLLVAERNQLRKDAKTAKTKAGRARAHAITLTRKTQEARLSQIICRVIHRSTAHSHPSGGFVILEFGPLLLTGCRTKPIGCRGLELAS